MPMSINFDDAAVKQLISPAKPTPPLRDIILIVRKSTEINALALMGRQILRSCVIARVYKPPISLKFEIGVDEKTSDTSLASVAERSGLLERLNLVGVATDRVDMAHILCAYLGASFVSQFKQHGANRVHDSTNDICSMVLDDDEVGAVENNSHEKMSQISGVQQMPPVSFKPEPPIEAFSPTPTRTPQSIMIEDITSNESVSSGRSPPPHQYGTHYQQPYQPPYHPYYPPNPSNPPPMQHLHPQPSPLPQRFAPYALGSVHTSSPSFMPSQPQPQPQYQPQYSPAPSMQYQTPPPSQHAPPQPAPIPPRSSYDQYAGMGGIPNNPPGYGIPPPIPMPPPPGQQTQGFISLFNELAMKHRMTTVWQQQKSGQQHIPEWTMWLMVDGQPKGYGTAATKQAAKEIAAKAGLQAMGWLPV